MSTLLNAKFHLNLHMDKGLANGKYCGLFANVQTARAEWWRQFRQALSIICDTHAMVAEGAMRKV